MTMPWLFGQIWLFCLLSFVLGALLTYLILRWRNKPQVKVVEVPAEAPKALVAEPETVAEAKESEPEPVAVAEPEPVVAQAEKPAAAEPAVAEEAAEAEPEAAAVAEVEKPAEAEAEPEVAEKEAAVQPVAAVPVVAEAEPVAPDEQPQAESDSAAVESAAADAKAEPAAVRPVAAVAAVEAKPEAETKAEDTKAAVVEPGRFPGSAKPLAGGAAPGPEYTIKGNEDSMLFHTTDSPYYGATIAEVWFKSEADAEAAGFTKYERKAKAGAPVVEPGKYPGSAKPLEGGAAPTEEYTIKGNEDSMLFHTTESPYYKRTIAEVWFKTEADAEAAGFTKYVRKTKPKAAPVEAGAYPGSAKPLQGGAAPSAEYTVKGNEDSMLFHGPDSAFYDVTVAEVWFKTTAEAETAGFKSWNGKPVTSS
ncbi:hypothetical protein D5S17_10875 [Pseudonocardiaceae bacterium YIM PH 21723]|nr:hypothetical protein D5S17_10875 [Pseudonocardiaceae bacterium YIM PH 21723]